jgi:hypothetical protein
MTKAATQDQRGYGFSHVKLRRRWLPMVAVGLVDCARCGRRIGIGEPWDLGHLDGDRMRYSGPEHAACNRSTAGRQRKTSRRW